MKTLGNPHTTRHLYQLNTDKGRIDVFANSRDGARKIAERAGYIVKDVNMIG